MTNCRGSSADNLSIGLVVTGSRRSATVLMPTSNLSFKGRVSPKITAPVVGDFVQTETRNEHLWVTAVQPRKNCLSRTYSSKTKEIAANLDRVYLVVAAAGLVNCDFIDRVLITCHLQNIPVDLVYNKSDLVAEQDLATVKLYQGLVSGIVYTSAVATEGIKPLKTLLEQRPEQIVALVGMSGVGKSSIINQLVKSAGRSTAAVSVKTGKGQQTTSQAEGFLFARLSRQAVLIIDLPGIQNFGICALPEHAIADCFPEFVSLKGQCSFSDCRHLDEPDCAVKSALDLGNIAISRYQSYMNVIKEIRAFKPY